MDPQVEIAVLKTQVESLIDKQKELTARVRANEKVVAAVTLLGTVVLAIVGAGYFAPKVDAASTSEWIHDMRQWKLEKERTPIDEMLNNAEMEYEHGCDDTTEQEELLQLPSDPDRQGS